MRMVAVSKEIRDPRSPVGKFFRSTFPYTDSVGPDVERVIRRLPARRPNLVGPAYPWASVGLAIDYRLRCYFEAPRLRAIPAFHGSKWSGSNDGRTIFSGERVSVHPYGQDQSGYSVPRVFAEVWSRLQTAIERVQPIHQVLETDDERELCQLFYALALFDRPMSNRLHHHEMLIRKLRPDAIIDELLALAGDEIITDLCRLSQQFGECWGARLFHRDVRPNPQLVWRSIAASADLLIDDCLIDIKATQRAKLDPLWLYQLLAYVLLDELDHLKVRRAGFYFARQASFVVWPVEQLVARLTGSETLTIARLQATLKSAAIASHSTRWMTA